MAYLMDLYINTLTGTVFELRVSPFEPIIGIKAKIQKNEGIPTSQQHLLWQSIELEDDYCLHDYNIKNGATLTLVLAMRDGPINMRRVSVEEPSLQEVAEYMDANRDEVWDKLMNDDKQVTLLVFRDGDQLNFFRVYDRGDGVLSPYSDTIISPGSSLYNNPTDDVKKVVQKEKEVENEITKKKMLSLQQKFLQKESKNVKHQPRPPSAPKPASKSLKKRPLFPSHRSSSLQSDDIPITELNVHCEQSTSQMNSRPLLPPVQMKGRRSSNIDYTVEHSSPSDDHDTASSILSNIAECNTEYSHQESFSSSKFNAYTRLSNIANVPISRERSRDTIKSSRRPVLKPLGALDKISASGLLSGLKSPPKEVLRKDKNTLPDISADRKEAGNLRLSYDMTQESLDNDNYKKLLNWVHPQSNNSRLSSRNKKEHKKGQTMYQTKSKNRRKTPEGRTSSRILSSKIHPHGNIPHLPPVRSADHKRVPPTLTGKKRTRCIVCAKKLGLATTYKCRCGNTFCSTHRYPETHTCSYDYKTEGRKLLEKNNPVVNAPKLPKI